MAITVNWQVTRNGFVIAHATNAAGTAGSVITSISGVPTFFVGGVQVSSGNVYGPIWCDVTHDSPDAFFLISPALTAASVVTMTVGANCINTALGGNAAISTQAAVPNYMGQLEPVFGEVTPWAPPSTIKAACNLDNGPWSQNQTQPHAANLGLRMFWTALSGVTITPNGTDNSLVSSWTPTTSGIQAILGNYSNANGIDSTGYPSQPGAYVISWVDANIGTSAEAKFILVGTAATTALSSGVGDGKPESGTTLSGGVRTVLPGNRVVITYANCNYASFPNSTHGYNMDLIVQLRSSSGLWASSNTITGFICVGPGDTVAAVLANPYAINQSLKSVLMKGGKGPNTIRAINTIAVNGYQNMINFSDCQQLGQSSYAVSRGPRSVSVGVTGIRFLNTDPTKDNVVGDGTYAWPASSFIYDEALPPDGTDMALGPYIDLRIRNGAPASQGGNTDNGQYLNGNPTQGKSAAVEITTSTPHNLRTGDYVIFPGGSATIGMYQFPITGGATTALPSVSVTNGSGSITFSSSVTLAVNQPLVFSGDSTGQAYITGGGTGTTFTMGPNFQGTTNAAASCNKTGACDLSNINVPVVVTGAMSLALQVASCFGLTGNPPPGPIQKLIATTAFPLSFNVATPQIGATAPFGFYPALAPQVGCNEVQMPLQLRMTDACCQAIADEWASVAPAGMRFALELCDEVWNNGFPAYIPTQQLGNMMAYCPNGIFNDVYAPATAAALNIYQVYVAVIAHKWKVIQARLDTYNRGYKVIKCVGGQWTFDSYMSITVAMANLHSIAFDRGMVAPYQAGPDISNTTWAEACATTGTNPGSLTIPQMFDVTRYYMKYSPTFWNYYSTNYAHLQAYTVTGTKPVMTAYEWSQQDFGVGIPAAVVIDGFYHPEFAVLYQAGAQALQDGNPTVPGSGIQIANHYTHGSQHSNAASSSSIWQLQVMAGQLPDINATGNLFTTDRATGVVSSGNGIPNDVTNTSPSLAAWLLWVATANSPSPTPTPTPTPAPGPWQPPQATWSGQLTVTWSGQLTWTPPQKTVN